MTFSSGTLKNRCPNQPAIPYHPHPYPLTTTTTTTPTHTKCLSVAFQRFCCKPGPAWALGGGVVVVVGWWWLLVYLFSPHPWQTTSSGCTGSSIARRGLGRLPAALPPRPLPHNKGNDPGGWQPRPLAGALGRFRGLPCKKRDADHCCSAFSPLPSPLSLACVFVYSGKHDTNYMVQRKKRSVSFFFFFTGVVCFKIHKNT